MSTTKGAAPPALNRRYVCIVDRDATTLAALISSYLFVPETYLPLFLLRKVNVAHTSDDLEFMSEAYFAEAIAGPDSVFIANALARLGDPEYLILAGLTDAQRSYLTLPKNSTLIEISTIAEVEPKLLPIIDRRAQLNCKEAEILTGLVVAQRQQKRLVVNENAAPLANISPSRHAAVVVERIEDSAAVVAINYGNSVDASILIVEPLTEPGPRQIQNWIQDWKERDSPEAYLRIAEEVERRVGSILFREFEQATFFTTGLPYSLILGEVIPFTYVNLLLKPDLFVLNSIIFSSGKAFDSAVVFSPTFFPDEETDFVCEFLSKHQYQLRPLIAQYATLAAFDFNVQYYPYGVLHICSHGGEVEGYEMSETFVDREGKTHTVEFDEVIGTTPSDKPGMVQVQRKMFPKTIDGLRWMSPELKEHGLPSHVSLDMWKCMAESKGVRKPKSRVDMSCAIACVDSIHQGQFTALASYSSPLVFNNTCWSWSEVAAFFLACGARGYIGTLWAIDNDAAITAARTFYENVFSGTVLSAFHKATQSIERTASKGIYIYWGLPFTSVSPVQSARHAREKVNQELVHSVERWVEHIASTKHKENRKNSIQVLRLLLHELSTHTPSSFSAALVMSIRRRIPDFDKRGTDLTTGEVQTPEANRSFDCPVELRQINRPTDTRQIFE